MVKSKILITICFLGLFSASFSQSDTKKIDFSLLYANQKIQLNEFPFQLADSNQFSIDVLKFYISKIVLVKNNQIVFQEKNSFHLIDASKPKSLVIEIGPTNLNFDSIRFYLGLDSICSVSGALSGDLDPTNGMYWTWQSGYINFKIEGKSKVCNTRNNAFQFHIGGYAFPNKALQTIQLPINDGNEIIIKFDLVKLFQQIDLKSKNLIMSPSIEAIEFSKKLSQCFITSIQ
jgi:hypothetical protein